MRDDQREHFARALGRMPSGLYVVTARKGDHETSFLGSWVMQAGFDPPSVSVAVGKGRPALPFMQEPGSTFAISVIGQEERGKLGPFYKPVGPGPNALAEHDVERTPGGLPMVKDCLAWLECRTLSLAESGDHIIVVGEVVEASGRGEEDPAIHVRKNGLDY